MKLGIVGILADVIQKITGEDNREATRETIIGDEL